MRNKEILEREMNKAVEEINNNIPINMREYSELLISIYKVGMVRGIIIASESTLRNNEGVMLFCSDFLGTRKTETGVNK